MNLHKVGYEHVLSQSFGIVMVRGESRRGDRHLMQYFPRHQQCRVLRIAHLCTPPRLPTVRRDTGDPQSGKDELVLRNTANPFHNRTSIGRSILIRGRRRCL